MRIKGQVILVVFMLFVSSCKQKQEELTPQQRAYKSAAAVGEKLVEMKGNSDPSVNTCLSAVKQPEFLGAIGREGAIIKFDQQDNPVEGITTRTFDRSTGKFFDVRELTPVEISSSAVELKDYYRTVLNSAQRKKIKTIVIFSETFKKAACDALLNMDDGVDYYLEGDIKTGLATVHRVAGGKRKIVAQEKIYYR